MSWVRADGDDESEKSKEKTMGGMTRGDSRPCQRRAGGGGVRQWLALACLLAAASLASLSSPNNGGDAGLGSPRYPGLRLGMRGVDGDAGGGFDASSLVGAEWANGALPPPASKRPLVKGLPKVEPRLELRGVVHAGAGGKGKGGGGAGAEAGGSVSAGKGAERGFDLEGLGYDELERRLSRVMDKIQQYEARISRFSDMGMDGYAGAATTSGDLGGGGSGGGGGGGGVGEIDPASWLRKMKRRVERLVKERGRIEEAMRIAEEEEGGGVVAWAECSVCSKERITTRLYGENEDYRCGMPDTWASIREGSGPITCDYPQETDGDAELVPDEYLVRPGAAAEENPLEECLLPLNAPGHGDRSVLLNGAYIDTITTPLGNYGIINMPPPTEEVDDGIAAYRGPDVRAMWEYFGEAIDGDHATEENLVAALAACLDRYTQDYTVNGVLTSARSKASSSNDNAPSAQQQQQQPQPPVAAHRSCYSTRVILRGGKTADGGELAAEAQKLAADGMAEEAVSLLERALLGEASSSNALQAACTLVLRSLASAKRADCADVAMQDIIDSGRVQPTAEMLNFVLAAYARDPQTRTLRGLSDALSHLQVFQQVDVTPDLTTFRLAAECCMQACGGTDWVGLNEAMALPEFMHKVWGIEATRDVRIAVIDCCLAWMRSGKTGAERRAADAISQAGGVGEEDADDLIAACLCPKGRFSVFCAWAEASEKGEGGQTTGGWGEGDPKMGAQIVRRDIVEQYF